MSSRHGEKERKGGKETVLCEVDGERICDSVWQTEVGLLAYPFAWLRDRGLSRTRWNKERYCCCLRVNSE